MVERKQRFQRRAPLLVDAAFAALVVDLDFGLGRGAVVVDVGVEEAGIKLVDGRGVGWCNVPPADVFAHDGRVFGLHQAVVAGAAGTAFGLLDQQLAEQFGDDLVDELASVVGVEVEDYKGELLEDAFQQGRQPSLGDALDSQHHLPLRDLIDGVDVVDPLALGSIALMHSIDAQKAGLAVGRGLPPFADLDRGGPGLFKVAQAQAIARAVAQVVEMAVGEPGQPLELTLAVNLELSLENMARARAAESLVRLVDCGQQLDVRLSIVVLVARPPGGLGGDPPDANIAATAAWTAPG